jgi:antitoxin (DNA-binding transcriptional repressor) of toxin-antitoxin stability system
LAKKGEWKNVGCTDAKISKNITLWLISVAKEDYQSVSTIRTGAAAGRRQLRESCATNLLIEQNSEKSPRVKRSHFMAKDVVHISETEAAGDFAALMARVRAGAEIIIENGKRPVAVLHAAEPMRRSVSECIALAKAHEEETGKAPVLDPDFAEDVEEILSHRRPWNPPAWE